MEQRGRSTINNEPRGLINNPFFRVLLAASAVCISVAPTTENPRVETNTAVPLPVDADLLVMTANVHSWESPDGSSNTDEFIEMLDKLEPDFVAIQEAILNRPFLSEIAKKMGYTLITAPTRHIPFVDTGPYGNALLSKYAVSSVDIIPLDTVLSITNPARSLRPRSILIADIITTDGSDIRVLSTHLESSDNIDAEQIIELQKYLKEEIKPDGTVIVIGDFNNPGMQSQNYPGFSPAYERKVLTSTAPNPTEAIDAIRAYGLETTTSVSGLQTYDFESDHLALFALVSLDYTK